MAQKAPNPIPEGMHTVIPHFWFNGNCREAIAFYEKAFEAKLIGQIVPDPEGKGVWHSMLKIGDSTIMLADTDPSSNWEKGPEDGSTMSIWMYVEDCDKVFDNAIKSGGIVMMPLWDSFWGDRFGKLKDPFGHCWNVATNKWIYTSEEMQAKEKEGMANSPLQ